MKGIIAVVFWPRQSSLIEKNEAINKHGKTFTEGQHQRHQQ